MKFILMLLSVYRITYMIVYESGPLGIFEKLRTTAFFKANTKELKDKAFTPYTKNYFVWQNIDEGINCEYCVSVWVSGIVWVISRIKFIDKLLPIFGLAGAWMVLNQLMEKLETNDD